MNSFLRRGFCSCVRTDLLTQAYDMNFLSNQKICLVILMLCVLLPRSNAQWTRIGLTDRNVYSLWAKGDTLLAGGSGGWISRSVDSGVNWVPTTTNMHIKNIVLTFLDTNGIIYAGAGYSTFDTCAGCGGVYRSTDRGMNWQAINAGFPVSGVGVSTVFRFANRLLAGTGIGLYGSPVDNIAWVRDSTLPEEFSIESSTIANSEEVYLGSSFSGIYRSTGTSGWLAFSHGLPRYRDSTYYTIGAMITVGDTIYSAVWEAGAYLRYNSLSGWKKVSSGLIGVENLSIGSFVSYNRYIFASTTPKVYYLERGDSLWKDFSHGLNLPFPGSSISVIRRNSNNLFAAVAGFGVSGVWRRPLSEILSVPEEKLFFPKHFTLEQNYPNPFNATTRIRFSIPYNPPSAESFATLRVYDISGRAVSTLVQAYLAPGAYSINFDGDNLASGVYICRLATGRSNSTRKLLLIR